MALRQVLTCFILLGCSGLASAGTLWANSNGSLVRTSDGGTTWMSRDWWNNALNQATADGAGGVTSTASQDVLVANEVEVGMTMTEASTAAEIAAAAAFLPEAALYGIAGAALGQLVWDAANQSYALQPTTQTTQQTFVCPDGSTAYATYAGVQVTDIEQAFNAGQGVNYASGSTLVSSSISPSVTFTVNNQGSNSKQTLYFHCPTGTPSPAPNNQRLQDVPPGSLPPYVLPWLQANPGEAPPLAGQEGASGHPPESSGPVLSGPSTVALPPTTTTTTNPDGSKSSQTITKTVTLTYSGPNASGSTTTVTSSSSTPAPTASDPNPSPTPGPTQTSSSAAPPVSSQPSNPFTPPDVTIPTASAVPPGLINLPVPTIDNSTGTCPAPIVLNLGLPGAETMTWDLTPWCTLAANLRPLVLTAAALAAAFLLVR